MKTDTGTENWRLAVATLAAAPSRLDAIDEFYRTQLGLPGERQGPRLQLSAGSDVLSFESAENESEPFYHFALLVPGNRFAAARDWLAARAPLLARPKSDQTTFEFDFWNAEACYVHDPAGNVVELIAHRGVEESQEEGAFAAVEIRGISELGIVTRDLVSALQRLRDNGLELWSGEVSSRRKGLGFVGRRAHTLILSPPGRPWLPTGRPAEPHPLEALISNGEERVAVRVHDGLLGVDPFARSNDERRWTP